jgi:DNA adenine methylase
MAESYTPLRYPGGKTKLFPLVSKIISSNNFKNLTYVEPFAGGAGLALKLLLEGYVERIVINDFDYAVFCIWDTILNKTEALCEFVENITLSVSEWQRQKEIYNNQESHTNIEIGEAAFYLNRTNVSGVLRGGIIGGISQDGNYKIDARFNRKSLIKTILCISKVRDKIDLYNWDAKDFINQIIPNYSDCFIYFDPPYVKKGHFLYKNSFNENDHVQLKEAIATVPKNG